MGAGVALGVGVVGAGVGAVLGVGVGVVGVGVGVVPGVGVGVVGAGVGVGTVGVGSGTSWANARWRVKTPVPTAISRALSGSKPFKLKDFLFISTPPKG